MKGDFEDRARPALSQATAEHSTEPRVGVSLQRSGRTDRAGILYPWLGATVSNDRQCCHESQFVSVIANALRCDGKSPERGPLGPVLRARPSFVRFLSAGKRLSDYTWRDNLGVARLEARQET